jgi:hypothetical protein
MIPQQIPIEVMVPVRMCIGDTDYLIRRVAYEVNMEDQVDFIGKVLSVRNQIRFLFHVVVIDTHLAGLLNSAKVTFLPAFRTKETCWFLSLDYLGNVLL